MTSELREKIRTIMNEFCVSIQPIGELEEMCELFDNKKNEMTIKELQVKAHENAVKHGFWDDKDNNHPAIKVALMHSELSEFFEEIRNSLLPGDYFISDMPYGPAIELADLAIRLFDCCEAWNIDLEKMIEIKMKYNESRPYKHGGKII